jgi:UPF0271 protein
VARVQVDLNADLGEGFGRWRLTDDEGLLEVVTSANVACGFHAGDPPTMRAVCERAASLGVAVGAQVSYRDLAGFGRRFLDVEPAELRDEVVYQVGALQALARAAGTRVTYVKPHGALHAAVATHDGQAGAVVEAVRRVGGHLVLLGAPGSQLLELAEQAGVRCATEAFPDRGYGADGFLLPRSAPGALVTDPAEVARRAVEMAGTADSLCVHGDSPAAVRTAAAVRAALEAAGAVLRPFAPPGRTP